MNYSEDRMCANWKDIYDITGLSRRTQNIPCFITAFSVTYVSFVFSEATTRYSVFHDSSGDI
jgi:hypothetical protein